MMEETITKTVKQKVYYCDICSKKRDTICRECRRDICKKHTVRVDPEYGDYTSYYCINCKDIMTPFEIQMKELDFKHNEIYNEMAKKLAEFKESLR